MRVFVAGASGALGSRLVPQLIAAGHEVTGTHRSPGNADRVRRLGAEPVQLDLLDPDAVIDAVGAAHPDAIIHQATALSGEIDFKHFDRSFHQTNLLRTQGTDSLLVAAKAAGVQRFVTQSYASARYARTGGMVKTEDDPLDPDPAPATSESSAAMRYLDETVTAAGGIALRYGIFYGAANDGLIEPVRKRMFPIVGGGAGVSSFIHLDDAAAATVLALEHRGPAIYNIVDDEPAPVGEWLLVAAGVREGARRQAATPRPALAGAPVRGRGRGDDGNGVTRSVECQGQARARLDAALPDLARGLRSDVRVDRVRTRAPARAGGRDKPDLIASFGAPR
jgi:2-alkyl-3-oxoalkanoate reductase